MQHAGGASNNFNTASNYWLPQVSDGFHTFRTCPWACLFEELMITLTLLIWHNTSTTRLKPSYLNQQHSFCFPSHAVQVASSKHLITSCWLPCFFPRPSIAWSRALLPQAQSSRCPLPQPSWNSKELFAEHIRSSWVALGLHYLGCTGMSCQIVWS